MFFFFLKTNEKMESILYRDQSGSVVAVGWLIYRAMPTGIDLVDISDLSCETKVVYHLLGKIGLSTVVVNGTRHILNRNFHRDALASLISTTFSRKIRNFRASLELVKTSKWNSHFPFWSSVWEFWSSFQEIPFPENISVRGDKSIFSFRFHPKCLDFLGKWQKNARLRSMWFMQLLD